MPWNCGHVARPIDPADWAVSDLRAEAAQDTTVGLASVTIIFADCSLHVLYSVPLTDTSKR